MADSKHDAPSWLHRVEEDEMRTLIRASANYARQGYDPGLATHQAKALRKEEAQATALDPSALIGKKFKKKKFENQYLGSVPTHYKNFSTGRILTTSLPHARPFSRIQERAPEPVSDELKDAAKRAVLAGTFNKNTAKMVDDESVLKMAGLGYNGALEGLHPSRVPLARATQVTYHPVQAQTVVLPHALSGTHAHHGTAKNINNVGLSRAALAALEDPSELHEQVPKPTEVLKRYKLFNTRGEDEAQGKAVAAQLNAEARFKNRTAGAMGPGAVVTENFAAMNSSGTVMNLFPAQGAVPANTPGLPKGAMSHAILQNRLGKAGVAPGPVPRGGSGLVVGDLLVSYEQLVPATLVASKWGRVSNTQYSDVQGMPCKLGVEVQPLYYESFILDLHAVLDRTGGFTFEPLVSPAAFVVDFGRVNAHVHGHQKPEPLESRAGQAVERAMEEGGYEPRHANGEGEGPGAGNTTFSVADVGLGAKKNMLEVDDLRAARARAGSKRRVKKETTREDIQRAELSMALDNARDRARHLILRLAEDGMEASLEKLLLDGLRVDWKPDPWYQKAAEEAAARAAEAAAGGDPSISPPKPKGSPQKQQDILVKPEVDHADDSGNTALMLAAKRGWIDVVLLLLRNGADHKRRNHAGQNALDLAKAESNAASLALSVGVQGAAQRKKRAAKLVSLLDDRTVLVCAQKGDMKRMSYLVDECDHPVNAVNQYGMTPLHFAVLRKDSKMAAFLRERGADIYARNNLGQSPLSLVLDMPKDQGQLQLLHSMDVADVAAAEEKAKVLQAEEERIKRQQDEERLVAKLKTYTKGTTAARAVYAALSHAGKAGAPADFSRAAAGSAAPSHGMSAAKGGCHAPALAKTIGLVTSPMAARAPSRGREGSPGRRARSASPSGRAHASLNLGPLKYKPITASDRTGLLSNVYGELSVIHVDAHTEDLRSSTKGLAESWNRHVSNYIAVAEKQQHALDSKLQRLQTEAAEVATAELRAGRIAPGDVDGFIRKHVVTARAKGPSYTGKVDAMTVANDPSAMIHAERGLRNITVPPPDSARFDAWARMRFGVA